MQKWQQRAPCSIATTSLRYRSVQYNSSVLACTVVHKWQQRAPCSIATYSLQYKHSRERCAYTHASECVRADVHKCKQKRSVMWLICAKLLKYANFCLKSKTFCHLDSGLSCLPTTQQACLPPCSPWKKRVNTFNYLFMRMQDRTSGRMCTLDNVTIVSSSSMGSLAPVCSSNPSTVFFSVSQHQAQFSLIVLMLQHHAA